MLDSNPPNRKDDEQSQELSIGDGFSHDEKYPYIQEFSEFLSTVSTKSLKSKLMTHQQRLLAKAMYEAENYGGSIEKCLQHLVEIYGPKWKDYTVLEDHMCQERDYCEFVLILDHIRQWDGNRKLATLREKKPCS